MSEAVLPLFRLCRLWLLFLILRPWLSSGECFRFSKAVLLLSLRPARSEFWLCLAALVLLAHTSAPAQALPQTEDERRQTAIAEFTQKMKDANYPALFDQAAIEFNVPSDLLKGIAFAETRWEHLTWPPGETASPATGMPRPYGIMSLWDNQYFGHSLLEAARLIGKDPEELKRDPLQNIRGAAALLRRLYDENPKPEATTESELESWRYAVRKYCGVPEPELNAQHALEVYTFINQGFHQFGVEWDGHPVNLEPIRQETARLIAEARDRRLPAALPQSSRPVPVRLVRAQSESNFSSGVEAERGPANNQAAPESPFVIPSTRSTLWFIAVALAVLFALAFYRKRVPPAG